MNNETRRILLVEDEKAIRDAVAAYLERENYWVTAVGDGQEALEEFQKHHFDLVVLDLMLPRVPGERVCRAIRDNSDVPIIMLTAKGEVEDRIIGLELGADDYLVKPFSPRELVARVRALLRRVHADSEPQREVLEFGDLTIDVSGHKVLVKGEEVDLTASEFKLLTTLSRYPGRVYSRMELVEKVLGYDFEGYERTIDSHVKNLRAKIGDNPRNPPGAVHSRQPCSSRISAPSLRSASKCRSMGLGPSSHPPGNDNLASPQRDRIAPKNTMDERISRMRLWGISQRVMPSAQTVKVSPVWVQRHPSRRKMVTAVCTSDSAGQLCSTVSPSQRSAAASSGSVLFFAPCTVSSPQRRLPPRTKTASCRAQPVCSSSYSSIYTPRIL